MGDESEAFELEADTQRKVSSSLSKIEVALSEWDSAKTKPPGLEPRIAYLRMSLEELSAWEIESLSGAKTEKASLERLRRFTELCDRLARARARLYGGKTA